MALADVYAVVSAEAILTGVTGLRQEIGREFIDELANPPSIVWVPTRDSFEYPGSYSAPVPSGQNALRTKTLTPRALWTRWAGVTVRVWVETSDTNKTALADIRALEELVRKLFVAIDRCAKGSYKIEGLDWVDADGAELVQKGRACDLKLAFAIPITDEPDTVAPLTVVNTSGMEGTLVLPTGDITGVPSP